VHQKVRSARVRFLPLSS